VEAKEVRENVAKGKPDKKKEQPKDITRGTPWKSARVAAPVASPQGRSQQAARGAAWHGGTRARTLTKSVAPVT